MTAPAPGVVIKQGASLSPLPDAPRHRPGGGVPTAPTSPGGVGLPLSLPPLQVLLGLARPPDLGDLRLVSQAEGPALTYQGPPKSTMPPVCLWILPDPFCLGGNEQETPPPPPQPAWSKGQRNEVCPGGELNGHFKTLLCVPCCPTVNPRTEGRVLREASAQLF